jgi:hypothetical protein
MIAPVAPRLERSSTATPPPPSTCPANQQQGLQSCPVYTVFDTASGQCKSLCPDGHETLVGAVPGIKFGLAFREASGKCLVRSSGTDAAMVQLAQKNAINRCERRAMFG